MYKIKRFFEDIYFKVLERHYFDKEIHKLTIKLGKDPKEETYTTVLNAVWKQIPREVNEYEDDDGEDDNGKPIIRHFYGCPTCNKSIYFYMKYCSECGQKLNFSRVWR